MNDKLLIVDGHSLLFRSYYAFKEEDYSSKDRPTNAIYGFFRLLCSTIRKANSSHLAIAFDVSRKSFRTKVYPEYKQNRRPTPQSLIDQQFVIYELIDKLGIKSYKIADYEGDDIVATLAKKAYQDFSTIDIYSVDRDIIQLINDKTKIISPKNGGGFTYLDSEKVVEKYGVYPNQYRILAALIGEKSDNLPGVPGVGPKTAVKLINKYDNIENIYSQIEEVATSFPKKIQTNLQESEKIVRRNYQLNQLNCNVDLEYEKKDFLANSSDFNSVIDILEDYELNGLKDQLRNIFTRPTANSNTTFKKFALNDKLEDGKYLDHTNSSQTARLF